MPTAAATSSTAATGATAGAAPDASRAPDPDVPVAPALPDAAGDGSRNAEIARHLAAMQRRSKALRRQASTLDPVLARAYRRRAAEVQLGAWAYALRTGHPEEVHRPSA